MTLSALLSPERVFINTEISSKKKLLELIAVTVAGATQSSIFNSLVNRERLGSTGLGQGFAVPHARLNSLDETIGYFFRIQNPVNFEAPDNLPVDLVFTIIIPEEATEEHLIILSSIAKVFSRADVCDALRVADNSQAMFEIIQSAEETSENPTDFSNTVAPS